MTLKKSPAGWLHVNRDQLRTQRSVTSMRELYFNDVGCYVGDVIIAGSWPITLWFISSAKINCIVCLVESLKYCSKQSTLACRLTVPQNRQPSNMYFVCSEVASTSKDKYKYEYKYKYLSYKYKYSKLNVKRDPSITEPRRNCWSQKYRHTLNSVLNEHHCSHCQLVYINLD